MPTTQVPNHNNNGLRAPPPHHRNGRKPSNTSADYDISDLYDTPEEGNTFKRYLDVHSYNDEDSSPNPSLCNQIPTVVTIETPHTPKKMVPQSASKGSPKQVKNPSPKPDLVTSGVYAKVNRHQSPPKELPRRLSLDTVHSEQSDIWKPMGASDTLPGTHSGTLPNHKGEPSRLYQWSDTSSSPVQALEKDAVIYHDQVGYQANPTPTRKDRRSGQSPPSRHDSGRRKGAAQSPDIFYSRPNKAGIRQAHHPV